MATSSSNDATATNDEDVIVMSTEALIMSLLGQVRQLEEERDNARLLAARMRERLEHISGKTNQDTSHTSANTTGSNSNAIVNSKLTKLIREVSSNMVNDLQQVVLNEQQRTENMKEMTSSIEPWSKESNFQHELNLYKNHYESLLEKAELEKDALRKMLKAQQDLVLDRDIKLKELEVKLNNNISPS